MKICHIITGLGFGGAERLLVNFSNIHSQEHEVHIIYLKENTSLVSQLDPKVKLKFIPLRWRTGSEIKAYLADTKPDVVHTHLGHADFTGMWASYKKPYKLFCTMHNIWFKWNWIDYIIFYCYRFLFNTVVKRTQVIAISQVVKEHVIKKLHVPPKRVHLLYNGIPALDSENTYPKAEIFKELAIDKNCFNVLFVGRLAPQKSVITLLKAAHLLKDQIQNLKVYIVGDGQLEQELKTKAQELELDNLVEFRSATKYPEKYFASCDVFVLPSIFEGMGIVLLEAFRAKLPVIASDTEGPKELIENNITGCLFMPGDEVGLADKIHLLFNNPSLRKEIGQNGYAFYREKFRIEDYASNLLKLYNSTNS